MPGLSQNIDVTVSDLPLTEFLRNIANSTGLNLNIDNAIQGSVTNNFTNVPAIDVLIFLCKEYNLYVTITGRIISISKIENPPAEVPLKKINIIYDSVTHLISMDLVNDSLMRVLKRLITLTGQNIIPRPELYNKMVTVYILNMDFENALKQMVYANDIEMTKKDGNYLLYPVQTSEDISNKGSGKSTKRKAESSGFFFNAPNMDQISVNAENVPILDIIKDVSESLKVNYFIYSEMPELTTVNLTNVNYEEFLNYILNGTKYTFSNDNSVYLIGERQSENIRKTKIIKMQYRSVVDIVPKIPKSISGNVEIIEFPELNSLILSGSNPQIMEIEQFLQEIDKVVPVILIEVLIVDHKSGFNVSTGIAAGISPEPVKSNGTLMPFNITMSSQTINNLINSFNGFGLINLGNVAPDFYLSLKALEDQGIVNILSTPRLATLNGHEATLTIGETEYYLEERSQIFANQTTTQEKIREFKPVTADFVLTINPIVAGDDQITLAIKVDQSDFTGTKLAYDAPPNQVSRSFNSTIRIRNEEMILLGGLEDKSKSNSGSGWPLLSRIPVFKWLFSSREKKMSVEKLNVFIKPTVIY